MSNFSNILEKHEDSIQVIKTYETLEYIQRTDEWFAKRKGRFTGSKISDLMKCSRAGAKLEWGRQEKLIDFGNAAKKYIFTKAMERKTGIAVKNVSTAAMKYGRENEISVKQLLDFEVEEVDFLEFLPGIAGASPDGRIKWMDDYVSLEIKCATSWDNYYERTEKAVDESHLDFWQLQAEMMALKVNKAMYVVAYPSESIFEPNIIDVFKTIVHASPIHQEAIIKRCTIGDSIIKEYLSGTNFHESIEKICSNYYID